MTDRDRHIGKEVEIEVERAHQEPLTVTECESCGEERLTTQTVGGTSLCSKCMREVPVGRRPEIAKRLGGPESSSPDESHLLGVNISEERWRLLQDESNQLGLSVSEYVRRILDRRADPTEYT